SSCWIRVAQAWAGTGFGNLAIPRVGQEVIVDFLNGDPDQPIIMGRTYHQENRTPGSLPGTKTQMTIRSKTYMGSGFNELKFDDATGNEQLYMHAQKNMDTEVLNNRTTDVKVNHTETVGGNQAISVTGVQSTSVKSAQFTHVESLRQVAVQQGQLIVTGGDHEILVQETLHLAAGKAIHLQCGESELVMLANGTVALSCTNFNLYAAQRGQITAAQILDLNMDGAKSGIEQPGPLTPSAISERVTAEFPPQQPENK
ncbi:TPA: type VI secretion system tip protein VgrG, partial [Escherichia coli]|nr:type VI secretion system tip protein VgrG [Escherichia coli]